MTTKTTRKITYTIAIIALSLIVIQSIQITKAQNQATDQWALSFSVENAQNVTSTSFTPFDQIRLSSTVTYGNASVPDLLVTFKVQGPTGSANPMNITSIAKTNAAGVADSTFRLPAEAENSNSVVGTWQATATIRTSNSTIQKTLSFTTQWNLEITSISIENQQGSNQTIFYPGNTVTVGLAISNADSAQQANITLNMQDASGNIVNQTQIQNTQISNGSSPAKVQTTLEIPASAIAGEASITAAIFSGTYQNIDVPAGENQTAYFTIVAPAATPTPTPKIVLNSVSLFSWLLIAVGLFTFTSLLVFLRRKSSPKTSQTPIFAPSTPSPETATPALILSTAPQETIQQPAPQAAAPTPKIAPEKVMEATVMSEINLNETKESALSQAPAAQATLAQLDRISSTAKRVQAIKATLESVREQLAQDLTELNKLVDERERALKNYFDTVREEMEKAKTHLTDIEDTSDITAKPNFAPDLAQEPISQAILTYRTRIASTEKRIRALNTALKLEKEQFAQDLTELNKAVDQQEKTLNNYFGILRTEIEKLQTYLTDKEY
jgi:uncharacterized protein YukE